MRRKFFAIGLTASMIAMCVSGCGNDKKSEENVTVESSTEDKSDNNTKNNSDSSDSSDDTTTASATKFEITSKSVRENEVTVAVSIDGKVTADDADETVESTEENTITFSKSSIDTKAAGVNVDGSTATITKAGTYVVTGTAEDGQIIIDTEDDGNVWVILADANITNKTNSPIYIVNAKNTILSAAKGTENTLTDAAEYTYAVVEDEEPNACIFSKDDLVISGGGKLTVNGNFNNGIASKDTLEINDIELYVTAAQNGIKGKDYLIIKSGTIDVTAGADGLKSDNETDEKLGYLLIENGNIKINAKEDGIQAQTCMKIAGGEVDITTGEGAAVTSQSYNWGGGNSSSDTSIKGIKAGVDITITGGNITINSEDDAIHTNSSIQIDDGTLSIKSGDDGIHADNEIVINNGNIDIAQSYEAIEAVTITVNDGKINLVSSDDGFNAAGGNDGSSMGDRPGANGFGGFAGEGSSNGNLIINGGDIYVNAGGDGLDSNGAITMTAGKVYVDGPENDGNGALDYDLSFTITGGELFAAGSSGMLQSVSENSTLYCITTATSSYQAAGTEFKIVDGDGNIIVKYSPSKKYNSVVYCSGDIKNGGTYTASFGDTEAGSVTVSSTVSTIGEVTGGKGGMGGGRGGNKGDFGERGNKSGKFGDNSENQNGEMPTRDMPQMPDGEMPNGDVPQTPDNSSSFS